MICVPGAGNRYPAVLTTEVLDSSRKRHGAYCTATAVACVTLTPESDVHEMVNRIRPADPATTILEPSFVVAIVDVPDFVLSCVIHGGLFLMPTLDHESTM